MGLFGKGKKRDLDLTETGVAGTAVITSFTSDDFWDRHATRESTTIRLTDVGVGSYTWEMELEVTVDGRPPYAVTGRFKIPAKAGQEVMEGLSVPVYVDPNDPQRIDINWDGFLAAGGAPDHGGPDEVHAALPDASRSMMVNGWVQATNSGQMSKDDFEKAIGDAVEAGMLTTAEGDAARAQIA